MVKVFELRITQKHMKGIGNDLCFFVVGTERDLSCLGKRGERRKEIEKNR